MVFNNLNNTNHTNSNPVETLIVKNSIEHLSKHKSTASNNTHSSAARTDKMNAVNIDCNSGVDGVNVISSNGSGGGGGGGGGSGVCNVSSISASQNTISNGSSNNRKQLSLEDKKINLNALKNQDPFATNIIDTAFRVAVYKFVAKKNEWVCSSSFYAFLLPNR